MRLGSGGDVVEDAWCEVVDDVVEDCWCEVVDDDEDDAGPTDDGVSVSTAIGICLFQDRSTLQIYLFIALYFPSE